MLGGDRRRIELAYSLMFTLPGTPVLRYGDELGMGDNLALPERTSCRTPMQWSREPHGGFTKNKKPVVPVIDDGPYSYQHVNAADQRREDFRLVGIIKRQITINGRLVCAIIGIWRIVAKHRIFDQKPKYIDTKTIDAAIEPKPQHIEHGSANFRVAPIQVGLLGKEAVQIILIDASVERPRRAAEL